MEASHDPVMTKPVALKVPKGMQDRNPAQMAVREAVLHKIVQVFKSHDAECLETPGVELKEVLTGKYGEDSKLIYDLADQGGEQLSLRYDLTVPFARYLAMNGLPGMRRYQIGPVYRRDNPSMTRGRYREFYQCDFDIAGPSEAMLADAECVFIVTQVLSCLGFDRFTVKVNHRLLLDGIFKCCGVPGQLVRPVCSAVDKLDKLSWEEVAAEMSEKGLHDEAIAKIKKLVQMSGGRAELVEHLRADESLTGNEMVTQALSDMEQLFHNLDLLGCSEHVRFDLSLARGLDYYTGLIFEAVLESTSDCDVSVGSVSGGGRYDKLVGQFSGSPIPCVGMSIGIERLFAIMEQRQANRKEKVRTTCTEVYVCSAHRNLADERLRLCGELWRAGLCVAHHLRKEPRLLDQFQYCEASGIPIALVLGDSELREHKVKLHLVASRQERLVDRDACASEVRACLESLGCGCGH